MVKANHALSNSAQDDSLRSWRFSLGRDWAIEGIAIDRQQEAKRWEEWGWNRLPLLFA